MANKITKTMILNKKAMERMERENILSIVERNDVVERERQCCKCKDIIPAGSTCVKIRTKAQIGGISLCNDCAKDSRLFTKIEKGLAKKNAKRNANNVTPFDVFVTTYDEGLWGFLVAYEWYFAKADNGNYVTHFPDTTAQNITPILDSIFTSSHKCEVTAFDTFVDNTEHFRKLINMHVNNAIVNKSVK